MDTRKETLLVLILSKKQLKANHNTTLNTLETTEVGFNIVKETIESKSQLYEFSQLRQVVGFNIVKETIESKSQPQIPFAVQQVCWF